MLATLLVTAAECSPWWRKHSCHGCQHPPFPSFTTAWSESTVPINCVRVTHTATKACLVDTLPQLIPHQAHFVLPSSVIPVLFLRHEFSEVLIDFCNSLLKRKIQLWHLWKQPPPHICFFVLFCWKLVSLEREFFPQNESILATKHLSLVCTLELATRTLKETSPRESVVGIKVIVLGPRDSSHPESAAPWCRQETTSRDSCSYFHPHSEIL